MNKNAPIIIKKIKKGGHGHHGGAWKVAYADFVTAMMAFFLLLWLLAATPAENLKGLADYFSPTMGLKDRMGIGFRGGQGTSAEGVSADDWASQGLVFGAPPSGPASALQEHTYSSGDGGNMSDAERFSVVQTDLKEGIQNNPQLDQIRDSVRVEMTAEGLKIEITDLENRPMFLPGGSELQDYAKILLAEITKSIRFLPNYIIISGHTNSIRYIGSKENYSNWELSGDRANATRKHLVQSGLDEEQIAKVIAVADRDPLNYSEALAPENRRITLLILKQSIMPRNKQVAPEKLLDGGTKSGTDSYIEVLSEGGNGKGASSEIKTNGKSEDGKSVVREIPALDPVSTGLEKNIKIQEEKENKKKQIPDDNAPVMPDSFFKEPGETKKEPN